MFGRAIFSDGFFGLSIKHSPRPVLTIGSQGLGLVADNGSEGMRRAATYSRRVVMNFLLHGDHLIVKRSTYGDIR